LDIRKQGGASFQQFRTVVSRRQGKNFLFCSWWNENRKCGVI